MVEVFTIGGGEYIVNTFNAVAAWTGGGGYRSLLRVVMVLGLIYSLLCVAFTMNVRVWMNWFIGSTLIYMCLMVPTVSVKVTDRINPSLAPAAVANVPLGLGVIASFTSQVGDWLTRTAETVFTMPSQLNYSTNGMVYGARLFDATRNFEIRDAEFATNLSAHFKNCVFGDIMLGQKSMTDLANAKDLWSAMGPGSVARSQPWVSRNGASVTSDIITCNNAYNLLSEQWMPMIAAHTPIWSKQAFPKLSTAVASAKLRADVPIVNQAFTASSANYEAVMRQNTAINAFMQARDGMAGGPGAASIDTFATTRADIQARNTYNSIAQQAMSWVPILNIVLTVVFYAMFPVIFPLFLMPQTGVGALKGYLTGFFYLASWGPLYVILHMICMTRATSAAQGAAEGGMSLGTFAGIGAVNAETATIAGFMLMSVPFLAAGLAKGAMSISGQATSVLNPAQNAAEAAAAEQTTGNYSYGNTSFANSTSNMRQSNNWQDTPMFSSGAAGSSFRFDNGATASSYGNGHSVIDTNGAISRFESTPTLNAGFLSDMKTTKSAYDRSAESDEASAAALTTYSQTGRWATGVSAEQIRGWETGSTSQHTATVDRSVRNSQGTSTGLEDQSAITQSRRLTDGNNRSAETIDTVRGTIGASIGGGGGRRSSPAPEGAGANTPTTGRGGLLGRAVGALPSIGGEVSKTGIQGDRLSHNADQSRGTDDRNSTTQSVRDDTTVANGASIGDTDTNRSGTFARGSTSRSSSLSREEALARAHSFEERARQSRERAQQLSQDISYAETHSMQMSTNLSAELGDWYARESQKAGGLDAPGLHEVGLTGHRRQVRDTLIAKFLSERQEGMFNEVQGQLHLNDPHELSGPALAGAGAIEKMYKPGGLIDAGGPGQSAAPVAAAEAIEAGSGKVQDARSLATAQRSSTVMAAQPVKAEIDEKLGKGFFVDPSLRK
ncbi:conjugal transfer protein TraG N-terminal domain-containing protein [Sphingomonas sp. BK481]|jgi:conjugal transfer mating pair stabilization protein TraG|uniref:conjugal transfer protein TraG N-terminal domain-containing protein n=1 Tax=Sphingomonas sp. BK481 TaxID=2586981 RepID=UPI00161FF283|nr:conjugal transfer protein TraG N-terminal domain-containing protein [Sphingomonas sp. BK481]MBB3588670.1 conjugal transfer mating pair stabilization protein TraG [Sphingomonas sp. BK481]